MTYFFSHAPSRSSSFQIYCQDRAFRPLPIRARKIQARKTHFAIRDTAIPPTPAVSWNGYRLDPYQDYSRILTRKVACSLPTRTSTLASATRSGAFFAWSASTGTAAWLLFTIRRFKPIGSMPRRSFLLRTQLVHRRQAVELYRSIEIRRDCLILEGIDVFWFEMMEGGWPEFQPDEEENLVLSGIYGTRFVAYLTARRFDEFDGMPKPLPHICRMQ